ncbi:MAG: HipA domain-containing protein [Propionibacteriaceae bacterium]|nr:HipA domain-containing protein [Propionibacteriaceae bacterium]
MAPSTSDPAIFVWVWLPGRTEPVPCGGLIARSDGLAFRYGERYLERNDALSLYAPQLPLEREIFGPTGDLGMPGCIRDAAPDAWGRRVILNRLTGMRGRSTDVDSLSEATFLMESASNRLGAIDFQADPITYVPREDDATLEQLLHISDLVDEGEPLPPDLAAAAVNGTTIGGARPKALVQDGDRQFIAKFSTHTDNFNIVGAEAACFNLARACGITVPDSFVVETSGRKVLLTERFDRGQGGTRRLVISGLTLMNLDEVSARYGAYPDMLDTLRAHEANPGTAGRELFERIAFNIAVTNIDDHARNHAAFWDGQHLELTPAYDLSPSNRSGETAQQAMAYSRDGRRDSTFAGLQTSASVYGLTAAEANEVIERIVVMINEGWNDAADQARLTTVDREFLWGHQILNPAVFYE